MQSRLNRETEELGGKEVRLLWALHAETIGARGIHKCHAATQRSQEMALQILSIPTLRRLWHRERRSGAIWAKRKERNGQYEII